MTTMMFGVGVRCPAVLFGCLAAALPAAAGEHHDLDALRDGAAAHVRELASQAYPDSRVTAEVGSADPRLRLARCARAEFFLPLGNRPWGSGSVGARCREPAAWTIYLTYRLRIRGPGLRARHPLPAGQRLDGNDVDVAEVEYAGDPGRYPRDSARIAGMQLLRPLAAGAPVRVDMVRRHPVIRAGQKVLVRVEGAGFQVSQHGIAQEQAAAGESVRLKTVSGRVIQGVAQDDGSVRVRP